MADVFVSYARSDKPRVAPLVAALEAQGWSVWWDPAITPGQEFDRQIAAELATASAVLVVWTPNSVESRWVRGEAREGADRGILVPVRFAGAVLPIDFRAFHTIDLDDAEVTARGPKMQETVRALGALVTRGRSPQPAAETAAIATPRPMVAPGQPRVTICVLPFRNLNAGPEQEAFAEGITGDIITELSRWRLLAVRSRSASFRYRGGSVDIDQVARELNVRFVVEGGVRRMGDRIRINVELIDTETGSHVWGERYDRPQAELFDVQDQVVQQIVSTLVGRVQVSDVERARRKPPSSLDAYECVLKGNALPWDDPQGFAEATRLFEKAIEIDRDYGIAHGMLAMMRCAQWRNDPGFSNSALDEAYALARRAVELDDGESTCHSLLAQIHLYRHSFERALQHMRRSVEINPNNQWNLADMGQVLAYVGRAEEAVTWFARAKEIDPYFDPPWYWRQAGVTLMVLHRFDEAIGMFAHITTRTFRIDAYMAACHARLGDPAQARRMAAECLALRPGFSIRQFMSKEPFKDPADAEYFAESLRLAGLPD
jgi:TolB-like protein/tetratricopeptide (TPR) repeat protein